MVKAIVPPLHSVSIQLSLTCFFADGSTHYTLHLQACRHAGMGGWGRSLLHLAFVAFQHVLEIFPYPFLQICLILLKGCLAQPVKAPQETLMHSQVWRPQID